MTPTHGLWIWGETSMVILDTNVISELLKRDGSDHRVVDWIAALAPNECRITTINVAEMLYGIALRPEGRKREALSRAINAIIRNYDKRTLPFDRRAAPYYAAIMAARRRAGHPIGVRDAMIAAIARSSDAAVATRNIKDFTGTGVTLINPWQ